MWRIIRKEILSNIITLRFSVGTALFLTLVVLFTFVLIGDYSQKLESYNKLVIKNETELRQLMTYRNLKPTVYKPPEIFEVFSKGVIENMRNSLMFLHPPKWLKASRLPLPKFGRIMNDMVKTREIGRVQILMLTG